MRFRAYSTDSEAESSDDDARRVDEEVGSASDASDDDGRRPPAIRARRREDSPISEPSESEPEESDEEPGPRRRRPVVQFDPAIKSPPHTQRALADPTLIPWAREIGVDPQKMHVMQVALFRAPEEEAALKAASRPPPRRKVSIFAGLSQKRGRDSEGEGLRTELRQVRLALIVQFSATVALCTSKSDPAVGTTTKPNRNGHADIAYGPARQLYALYSQWPL